MLVKDLLRKYPQWSHDCIAVVGSISSHNIQEPKAKAALIWMLGEYSQDMQDAPYILESLIENWDEEHSSEVLHCVYHSIVIFHPLVFCVPNCYAISVYVGAFIFHFSFAFSALGLQKLGDCK